MLSNQRSPSSIASSTPLPSVRSTGAQDVLRSKNKKKDDAIRKKVELELEKRSKNTSSSARLKQHQTALNQQQTQGRGTVSSLRPAPGISIDQHATIVQVAELMAAKRTDAVLVVSAQGQLIGILTDKDICYRVVAEGLDVKKVLVEDVMTRDPIAVFDVGSRNEALSIMVSRKFRHLPVLTEAHPSFNGGFPAVAGLLDITKCVFEHLEDLEKKVNEDTGIMVAMQALERRGTVNADRIDTLRYEHEVPTIGSVTSPDVPSVSVRGSVRDAAKVMRAVHGTAVLVLGTPDGEDKVAGIFTTKDIVLRAIAANLDPTTTSVIRVMTPHPDFVGPEASILVALRKLHKGRFLHLPVIEDTCAVGLIDVMTLTIAMLTYLMSKSGAAAGLGSGEMWTDAFWNTTFQAEECASVVSESRTGMSSFGYRRPERASSPCSVRESVASRTLPDSLFSFKLKEIVNGEEQIYRFSSSSSSLAALYVNVCAKTGCTNAFGEGELDLVLKGVGRRLCYLDEDDDVVLLDSDTDLVEAVRGATDNESGRLVVYLGVPVKVIKAVVEVEESEKGEVIGNFVEGLKTAPLAVNVALSAAIVVFAYYIIRRIG